MNITFSSQAGRLMSDVFKFSNGAHITADMAVAMSSVAALLDIDKLIDVTLSGAIATLVFADTATAMAVIAEVVRQNVGNLKISTSTTKSKLRIEIEGRALDAAIDYDEYQRVMQARPRPAFEKLDAELGGIDERLDAQRQAEIEEIVARGEKMLKVAKAVGVYALAGVAVGVIAWHAKRIFDRSRGETAQ